MHTSREAGHHPDIQQPAVPRQQPFPQASSGGPSGGHQPEAGPKRPSRRHHRGGDVCGERQFQDEARFHGAGAPGSGVQVRGTGGPKSETDSPGECPGSGRRRTHYVRDPPWEREKYFQAAGRQTEKQQEMASYIYHWQKSKVSSCQVDVVEIVMFV